MQGSEHTCEPGENEAGLGTPDIFHSKPDSTDLQLRYSLAGLIDTHTHTSLKTNVLMGVSH
jgi:hypothetical protein